jgi:hypothetical protein
VLSVLLANEHDEDDNGEAMRTEGISYGSKNERDQKRTFGN